MNIVFAIAFLFLIPSVASSEGGLRVSCQFGFNVCRSRLILTLDVYTAVPFSRQNLEERELQPDCTSQLGGFYFPAGLVCKDFAVVIQPKGDFVSHPNNLVETKKFVMQVFGGLDQTFSRVDDTTCTTVSDYFIPAKPGSFKLFFDKEGRNTGGKASGATILFLFPGETSQAKFFPPGPSSSLVFGSYTWAVEPDGRFNVLKSSARVTDLCAKVAP